ncbi:hypothetical protein Trydic_g18473, partial [Trypoxylus dichotomus]
MQFDEKRLGGKHVEGDNNIQHEMMVAFELFIHALVTRSTRLRTFIHSCLWGTTL